MTDASHVRVSGTESAAGISGERGQAVTLVLSREVTPGHEKSFEAILQELTAEVERQPGYLDVTVLKPPDRDPQLYTIVVHFRAGEDAEAWLASEPRARLVAEADLHTASPLQTRMLSGLEAWLATPGAAVVIPPARWKIALVSAVGLVPLLEFVTYVGGPHLTGLPEWLRPVVATIFVIPLMQYAVMPVLTRVARRFLYPTHRSLAVAGS